MRALTGYPPWFGLIAVGIKLVENRPRPIIPRSEFGKPIAIHRGAPMTLPDERVVLRHINAIDPSLLASFMRERREDDWPPWYRAARGPFAVIATAIVDRAVAPQRNGEVRDLHTGDLVELGAQRRWLFGPVGYVLRDVRPIEPVGCRGHQGLWTLTPEDAEIVAARAGLAA